MKIKVSNLYKKIQGHEVLKNINLELEGGRIYGIYGRNGSGKTMFLRSLAGIIDITSGEIICDGKKLHKDIDILPDLGIIIENIGLWKMYSGFENLKVLASINKKINNHKIYEVLDKVGLDPKDRRSISKYSLGMRQRLAIAQAIMENPKILILDEPTNSLDGSAIEMFRQLMLEEKKKGTLIVIASHNKEDIELLSDVKLRAVEGVLSMEDMNYDKDQ